MQRPAALQERGRAQERSKARALQGLAGLARLPRALTPAIASFPSRRLRECSAEGALEAWQCELKGMVCRMFAGWESRAYMGEETLNVVIQEREKPSPRTSSRNELNFSVLPISSVIRAAKNSSGWFAFR